MDNQQRDDAAREPTDEFVPSPDDSDPEGDSAHHTTDGEGSHDRVDEWGEESFPASDPPGNWAGADEPPA